MIQKEDPTRQCRVFLRNITMKILFNEILFKNCVEYMRIYRKIYFNYLVKPTSYHEFADGLSDQPVTLLLTAVTDQLFVVGTT